MTSPQREVTTTATASAVSAGSGETPAADARELLDRPVIFFDGECGLCDSWVSFVLARDKRQTFRFGTLQGKTARNWLHLAPDANLDSLAFADGDGVHRKSEAVWRIFRRLGGVWPALGLVLRVIPRPIRDGGYDFIARRRYRWFGKKETCRVPTPEERERFLP
ncbi:MAG TPA: DCC1-like thiol-disulfide oxidoreductase family protein [Planctomycetaceae bacterium]|nr:DCC1-like thiol-disulfide oxidoreductase family protein [Planctomycetaceae bacterium]